MIRQRACAPVDILCRRDRAVVTTFGRAGIRPAARPRRHFSDTSPALRPFFAQPYTVTAAARQPVGTGSAQIRRSIETNEIVALCEERIEAYKEQRGKAIWQHRAVGFGAIPGRLRDETLKRAGFRCELCGVPADERALDVDHIHPRRLGGADVLENFHALCWKCNTNKGAGDNSDFRNMNALYAERRAECPFCELSTDSIIAENSLGVVFRDNFPVWA
jgi:5-methylcytosine-specific restriction endonuclease McrA